MYFHFQYGFRSSRLTADLQTVESGRIARPFNKLRLLELQHWIYPKFLTGFTMLVLFINVNFMEFKDIWPYLLFSLIDVFGLFWMGNLHNNIQLMLEFLKAPFLFHCTEMTFLMMSSVTLYSKCDQATDLWQQAQFASKLESDLWDTLGWTRKWLVDYNARKAQLVLFDWFNNTHANDVKMD